MDIEFDPAKDDANVVKHGISLARSLDLRIDGVVRDERYDELRYRFYGTIDGVHYCLAATHRGDRLRAISLRRAHAKEYRRHAR